MSDYRSIPLDELRLMIRTTETVSAIDAYEQVPWFGAAIDARRNAFSNVPFDLMSGENVQADDSDFENLPPELNVFYLLDEMLTDLDLYGRAYAYYETSPYGTNGKWRRFVPNDIREEIHQVYGLQYFQYLQGYRDGFQARIDPADPNLIYLWMPNFRRQFYPGVGVGGKGLLAATAILNRARFTNAFFENGAIQPTFVRIKGFSTLPEDEKERTRTIFTKLWSGLRNAFKVHPIDGDEVDVVSLMQNLKDMVMRELTETEREEIATALNVTQTILLANAANYATAQMDEFNFYDKWIVPFAENIIAKQINERFFAPRGYKLQYRKQRMDTYQDAMLDKTQSLVLLSDRALIDDDEVRMRTGFPQRDPLDARIERLSGDAQGDDAGSAEAEATQAAAMQKAMTAQTVGKEAYVSIDFAGNAEIQAVQERLRLALPDTLGVRWQSGDTLHATLVYCYDIDDGALIQAAEPIRGFEAFDARVSGLGVFNSAGSRALHLLLDHNPALDTLQKRIWVEFAQRPTSEYSIPQQWQPHITLCYLPDGVDAPQLALQPFTLRVERVHYQRDDYEPFITLRALSPPEAGATPDMMLNPDMSPAYKAALDDIDKWERMALKRLKEGKARKMLDFNSEHIVPVQQAGIAGALEAVESAAAIKGVFMAARAEARGWLDYA